MPKVKEGGSLLVDPFTIEDGFKSLISDDAYDMPLNSGINKFPLALLPYLIELKSNFGDAYLCILSDYTVLHRLLTRAEYESYASILNINGYSDELAIEVCDMAISGIRSPYGNIIKSLKDIDSDAKAYTANRICQHILELSDFNSPQLIQNIQDLYAKSLSEGVMPQTLTWHLKSNVNNISNTDVYNMTISQYGEAFGAISHFSEGKTRLEVSQKSNK